MKCVLKSSSDFVRRGGKEWTCDIDDAMVFDIVVHTGEKGTCVGVSITPPIPEGFYNLAIVPVKTIAMGS